MRENGFVELLIGNNLLQGNQVKLKSPLVVTKKKAVLKEGKLSSLYALEDGAAIHFKNDKLYKNISFVDDAKVFIVEKDIGEIKENVQKMYSLL